MYNADEIKLRHANYYLGLLYQMLSQKQGGINKTLRVLSWFDEEWGQIEQGFMWAANRMPTDNKAAQLCCEFVVAGTDILVSRLHPSTYLTMLQVSLEAAIRLGDSERQVLFLHRIGKCHFDMGQLQAAVSYYKQSLEIADREGYTLYEAHALYLLGQVALEFGDAKEAIN